jgi:uncharacterized membrane protein YfcA
LTFEEAAILIAGGIAAGVVNTMAGGGSLISVPLLVLLGLPGTVANGTNRVGILLQNVMAAWQFRKQGVSGLEGAAKIVVPVGIGALLGALTIAQVDDAAFERLFGIVMLLSVVPILRSRRAEPPDPAPPWPRWLRFAVLLAIGFYGGAIQAGVGLLLVAALSHAGEDLVRANSIKVAINVVLTAIALPVFLLAGQVVWPPALVLASGFVAGGWLGARLAVAGGERVLRPVMIAAIVLLAGRILGLY